MIYWDHNAGALLRPEIAQYLTSAFAECPGNPSSVHQVGRRARRKLDEARERVAKVLGCTPREIVFTASGSEAAALAILGAFRGRKDRSKRRVVTTAIEHASVLGALKQLESEGAQIIRVAPGADGAVPTRALVDALDSHTGLCTVQWVNNETGVLQPVSELSRICAERMIIFHSDAVQAFGRIQASLREVPADLLSLSAHKLGGPPGIGALYVRNGVALTAQTPGHQEQGRRGGTPAVALAQALAMALELAASDSSNSTLSQVTSMRDLFERKVRAAVPDTEINGAGAARVGNTSNLHFPGVDAEALLISLDLQGICVSTGAACASGSLAPSHVLLAMGFSPARAHASLRFSIGTQCNEVEVDAVATALADLVPRCRS